MGKKERKPEVQWQHPAYQELHDVDKQIDALRGKQKYIHAVMWQRWAAKKMDELLAKRAKLVQEVQRIWHEARAKQDGKQS